MARYRGSSCRLCRREMMKLFLKGAKCITPKCPVERREYPPGQHGRRRSKLSDYAVQLREKQRVRRMYGVLERQFRRYFHEAARSRSVTGEKLLELLERRLDNVIFRLGFAGSRAQARQFVRHGHVLVDGRRVSIPSWRVHAGHAISVQVKDGMQKMIEDTLEAREDKLLPSWLKVDAKKLEGEVLTLPSREHVQHPIKEQLIVELYSK